MVNLQIKKKEKKRKKMNKAVSSRRRKYIKNYDNKILMRSQFILKVYVYRQRLKRNIVVMVPFMDSIDMSPGFVPLLGCRLLSKFLEPNV